MRRAIQKLACFLLLLPTFGIAQQKGYSTDPLANPIFDSARVIVETTAINNWLNANYKSLSGDQMKGPREHLYYLIDSRVKDTYARTGKILPAEHDIILELLFSWAERLGAYGGSLVYNKVRLPSSRQIPTSLQPPKAISLVLEDDLLTARSTGGWSVKFPYYFMVWNIGDFDAANGLRTQVVALSTGAAKDKSPAGQSQATLMLLFSPGADPKRFVESWRTQLNVVEGNDKRQLPVRGLQSLYRFDPQSKLHTEFTSWSEKQGPFAVVYLGIDGTYQWNRQHFVDFLRALQIN